MLAIWGKIMIGLPNSRLRFQSKQLVDSHYCEHFYLRLADFGIKKEQVSLHGMVLYEDYLKAHAEVDFILDTFPFTGGTTTCEALWMGVPTLTLAGNTLIARQGASLLFAAGLPDWVTENMDEYIEKALNFATDLEKLAQIRVTLRKQVLASPLFDHQRFSQNFASALWDIWNRSNST